MVNGPLVGPCFAHVLNNACNPTLRKDVYTKFWSEETALDIKGALLRFQVPSTYMRKSSLGYRCSEEACRPVKSVPIKLPTSVKARFVSHVSFLQASLKVKDAIIEYKKVVSRSKRPPKSMISNALSKSDWLIAECTFTVLKHPAKVVQGLEGYEPISSMLMKIIYVFILASEKHDILMRLKAHI